MPTLFSQFPRVVSPMCAHDIAQTDLAAVAQMAIEEKCKYISVAPSVVEILWPWIENAGIKIAARFALPTGDGWDGRMYEFVGNVNAAFRQGVACAQVFVRADELQDFANALQPIRDDLFFNRELTVALDVGDIDFDDWDNVFGALARIKADAVMITLTRDAGDKSDFVGRIYGLLKLIPGISWHGALHFALGARQPRIEQVYRLTAAMYPDALANMMFFVNN